MVTGGKYGAYRNMLWYPVMVLSGEEIRWDERDGICTRIL